MQQICSLPNPVSAFTPDMLDIAKVSASEILDALPDGAYITDSDRRIVYWSRAAERITGWTCSEVVGHCCRDNLLIHQDKDGHALCCNDYCPLHRAIVTGTHSEKPVLVFAQHKRGHRVPVEVSVAPLLSPTGRILGGVEVFRDMTGLIGDMERAKAIQEDSLKSPIEEDGRISFDVVYRPQELIGGDFYRIEQISRDDYIVFIADVMGHGLASALYTMQLRSIWEEARITLVSPGLFMAHLNEKLHQLARNEGYFATAFCGIINLAHGEFAYVRAGHPAPLLFRSGGDVEKLAAASPAVGLSERALFKEATVSLDPGDQILLYTDGALDVVDSSQNVLCQAGLLRLIEKNGNRPDPLWIEQNLLNYSGGIRLEDDLTLIRIEIRG